MIEVAHVMAQEGVAAARQCKDILELATNSKCRLRAWKRQLNRHRRITA